MTHVNGDIYKGEWKNEKYLEGIMTYANGDSYQGQWEDNKYHG